jgi:hypothetical protein
VEISLELALMEQLSPSVSSSIFNPRNWKSKHGRGGLLFRSLSLLFSIVKSTSEKKSARPTPRALIGPRNFVLAPNYEALRQKFEYAPYIFNPKIRLRPIVWIIEKVNFKGAARNPLPRRWPPLWLLHFSPTQPPPPAARQASQPAPNCSTYIHLNGGKNTTHTPTTSMRTNEESNQWPIFIQLFTA